MVTPNVRTAPDFELPAPIKVYIVLTSCTGDSPAQSKISNSRGHNAYLACRWCTINGKYLSGAVRFLGYSQEAAYGKLLVGANLRQIT